MKNLILPLLLTSAAPLFAGVESPVMAPPPADCQAGWTFGLEALYLAPFQSDGNYDDNNFDWGGRGSIGYDFNDCLFIKATYFGYNVDVLDYNGSSGNITTDEHGELDASYADLVVGQHFKPSDKLTLSPYVGLRWATIEEQYEEHIHSGITGRQAQAIILDQTTTYRDGNDFSGYGVVVGIDANRTLGSGFSLYGTAKQAVVFGDSDITHSRYIESDGIGQLDDESYSDDRLVFITELGLGVQYGFNFSNVAASIHAGVEGQWWAGLSGGSEKGGGSGNTGLAGFVIGADFKL